MYACVNVCVQWHPTTPTACYLFYLILYIACGVHLTAGAVSNHIISSKHLYNF